MNTTIKLNIDTRKKLKLLAVLLDKSMIDVMELLVDEALKKAQASGNSQGIQIQNLPNE